MDVEKIIISKIDFYSNISGNCFFLPKQPIKNFSILWWSILSFLCFIYIFVNVQFLNLMGNFMLLPCCWLLWLLWCNKAYIYCLRDLLVSFVRENYVKFIFPGILKVALILLIQFIHPQLSLKDFPVWDLEWKLRISNIWSDNWRSIFKVHIENFYTIQRSKFICSRLSLHVYGRK